MKKITLTILALLEAFSLSAFDLSGYKAASDEGNKQSLVANGSFEQESIRYPNDDGAYVKSMTKFGRNGGGGLRIICNENARKNITHLTIVPSPEPGKVYRLGCWVRKTGTPLPIICVESYTRIKPSKYKSGNYSFGPTTRREGNWIYYAGTFTVKEKDPSPYEYRVVLGAQCPGVNKGGEIFFDDLEIFEDRAYWYFEQSWPTHHRISPVQKMVRFSMYTIGSLLAKDAKPLLLLEIFNADKKKIAEKTLVPPVGHIVETSFGRLPKGKMTLKASLLDTKNKVIGASCELPLLVADPPAASPSTYFVDEYGRTIVNGKPKLMIGVFSSYENESLTEIEKDLKEVSAAGFNWIHDFQFIWRHRPDADNLAYLDLLQKYGLAVAVGLYRLAGWEPDNDAVTAKLRHTVELFRNHPAVHSWYLQDEPPPSSVPRLTRNRRLINKWDPKHVCWGISVFPEDTYRFQPCTDVFGFDYYPFVQAGKTHYSEVPGDAIEASGMPYWNIPQSFNWGNYQPDPNLIKDLKRYNKWIEPSENQMLAHTLLHAGAGAKSFIFYSRNAMKKSPPDNRFHARWERLVKVVKTLRDMEPWLNSKYHAEKIRTSDAKGKTRVLLFTADNGAKKAVIIAFSEGTCETSFTLPESIKTLKSRYGKTAFANGKYMFKGDSLGCDILD